MNDKLNGRKVYLPRGRNPLEDLNILADCLAGSNADLFDEGDCIILIAGGKRVPVNPSVLREISTTYVVTKHPRETPAGVQPRAGEAGAGPGGWEVEYRPYEPDEMTLRALLMAKTREEGSLMQRVPKWPSAPRLLSGQHEREARARLKTGEPHASVAASYNVTVDTIKQLAR